MFDKKENTFSLDLGDEKIKIDTTDLTEQANGSCIVQQGDTTVLVTAAMSDEDKYMGFFPLSVNYEEKYYAAGEIFGSRFIRRETSPSTEAKLTARAIDRAIRPQFPKNLKREVQIIITCLSWDEENDPDVLGLIGASVALSISDIPWDGPVGGVRVGKKEDKYIINPSYKEREEGELDFFVAGVPSEKDTLINMIESDGKEVQEDEVLTTIDKALPEIEKLIKLTEKIKKKKGKEKIEIKEVENKEEIESKIEDFLGDKLEKLLDEGDMDKVFDLKDELVESLEEDFDTDKELSFIKDYFDKKIDEIVHQNILEKEQRPDGRELDQVRDLECKIDLLPKVHGSGLFRRGKTKALSILTLGSPGDVKTIQEMEQVGEKSFMHHYNFPPYSVGEVQRLRAPGRREIGHGMLGEKAIRPLLPSGEDFPYTIRVVTEILSSNGSTSQASISGTSLALMSGGVPIKTPAAGIAMGLIKKENDYKILTDIQGPEDHHGDMDFKVAGTKNGITAIQLDVKVDGLNKEIIKETLKRAKKARLTILKEMKKTIDKPRPELSPTAPSIELIKIDPEKISAVIGTKGKVINKIIETFEVDIDIKDDGRVFVTGTEKENVEKAVKQIKTITKEVEPGEIFKGEVKKIFDFGALVEIAPGKKGLIHISELSSDYVENVEKVLNIGDTVKAKVISIDDQGRINLSLEEVINKNSK